MAGSPVAFGGTMPAADVNGLLDIAADVMTDIDKGQNPLRIVVGLVDVVTTTGKPRKDEPPRPTLAFRHVEVAITEEDRKELAELLHRIHATRTGHLQLPFAVGATIPPPDPFPEMPSDGDSASLTAAR